MTETNGARTEQPKFWTGGISVMSSALYELNEEDIHSALDRHLSGDWGDLCAEDNEANENALLYGGRLFSAYHDRKGVKFWIITESDRSATTVLLPNDY